MPLYFLCLHALLACMTYQNRLGLNASKVTSRAIFQTESASLAERQDVVSWKSLYLLV
jgi:hypothetical protein